MNCLVIAATPIEIAPFLTYLKKENKFKYEIDVLITGIGLTATTYALLNQINIKNRHSLFRPVWVDVLILILN
jgi:hypothetical protein